MIPITKASTGFFPGETGFNSWQRQKFLFCLQYPDQLWGPRSFQSNVHRRLNPQEWNND